MNKLQRLFLIVPVMALAVAVVAVPVSAVEPDTTNSNTGTTEEAAATNSETRTKNKGRVAAVDAAQKRELSNTLRDRGDSLLKESRKSKPAKTDEERTKSCVDRKKGLQTKVNRISTNAKKHQDRIAAKYDKAVAFQATAQLDVANYDDLVAAVAAAQAEAEVSVAALAELKPTIDCTSSTVAADVAIFKAAAAEARTDLQAYKKAVKEVFVALMNAKNAESEEEATADPSTETEDSTVTTEGQ